MKLQDLGFEPFFESQASELKVDGAEFARISAVDRGAYLIRNERGEIPAELSGKLAYRLDGPADFPCVGDWVAARYHNNGTAAIIYQVLPRKSFLHRKTPGKNIDYQMIAANIDTAFVVQSCHFDFNPNRLDRYLIMVADGNVEPIVVLTKADLVSREDLDSKIAIVKAATSAQVIAVSNISGQGFSEFQQVLSHGKTYCLLGSSGVGKTTIINRILGKDMFETRNVSHTGEGTHTTSRRQLIVLNHGAILVDTPGMRELGVVGTESGLNESFEGIAALAANCRFANCTHRHEPGCAVKAAIQSGALQEERLRNYVKLKKESDFHEMSYLERRRKEKKFSRAIKSKKIIKHN